MCSDIINFLSGHGRWCIAVLEAYLDESGTHAGAPLLCVAGYVGKRKQWGDFEKEWFPMLEDSLMSCFHAVDSKCNRLRRPLAAAIDKGNFTGIICSIKPDTFNAHASGQLKSQMGDAYAVCAISCAWAICRWAYNNNLGSVSFAYETGRPNADFVQRALLTLQRHNDPKINIAAVSMVKKEECPHIATADFLSHVYGTHTYNVKNSYWLEYLTSANNIFYNEISKEKLIEMSEIIKEHYIKERRWKQLQKIMRSQEEAILKPNGS